MTVFEKVKLARVGNKEARGLLVRDRNKLVAAAAVTQSEGHRQRDPRVREGAQRLRRSAPRIIARNPDWTRNYQVKVALTANPALPATNCDQIPELPAGSQELRGIMKSKEVPSAVATHARRILQRKGK